MRFDSGGGTRAIGAQSVATNIGLNWFELV